MLDHTLWCGSLPASLSLSHSPSVCRYLSPAVRLRRRCPPPGTCGGETWKEHGRGGGAGTAHWAGCKAVRVLITIYGPECDDFCRKAERNAALGSTNDWGATISNVERRDLEIWCVAALPLELLQPTDLQLGCFFRLITACSCSSRELVRGSASYVLWQSPGGTRLQRNGTERCCSGALLQRMPSGSSGDRMVGKHAMLEIATSSAATIPAAAVLRIAGTNADANELPPD